MNEAPEGWANWAQSYALSFFGFDNTHKELIGEGAFGLILKTTKNRLKFAVKLIYIGKDGKATERLAEAEREAEITKAMADSDFVVPVCDSKLSKEHKDFGSTFMIVLPLAEYDLTREILSSQSINKPNPIQTLIQMALAVRDVHKKGIIHRDIKLNNFLRMKDGRVMLTDFGLAMKEENVGSDTGIGGTPFYIPHDVKKSLFAGAKYITSKKADIFALGISMAEYLISEFRDCFYDLENCILPKSKKFDIERSIRSDHFFSQLKTFYKNLQKKKGRKITEVGLELENFIFTRMLIKAKSQAVFGFTILRASAEEVVEKFKELFPEYFEAIEEKYGNKPDYCKEKKY